MFNLFLEQRLSLTELARLEGVSIPTVWRWRQRGIRGIRLETCLVGGRRYTSRESFNRFVESTTAAADGEPACTAVRTSKQREAAIARAERELDAAGI